MQPARARILTWLGAGSLLFAGPLAPAVLTPDRVLVVYNESLPESAELAKYYCLGRGIPAGRMLGIRCPSTEEISRAEFERTVRDPIDAHLLANGLIARTAAAVQPRPPAPPLEIATQNEIYGLALCWGVPLRIADDTNRADAAAPPAMRNTAAAVDSELALLPMRGVRLSGAIPNPFFKSSQGFDGRFARNIMLVTRLDGPSPTDVRARLAETWQTEHDGLVGWACFDARGIKEGGYKQGDDWLVRAAATSKRWGMPTALDENDAIVGPEALWSDVALYGGWYAGSISGALAEPSFRFRPGAVAYHIHSFSASTVRNAGAGWVAPLVARGAAATLGSVLEPYLSLTPNVDILIENLLAGRTFAEAAYASQPALSWMITTVGDPLYRPFSEFPEAWLQERLKAGGDAHPWHFFISVNRRKNPTNIGNILSEVDAYLTLHREPLAQELGGKFFEDTFDPDKAISAYMNGAATAAGSPSGSRIALRAVRLLIEKKRFPDAWAALDRLAQTAANDPIVRSTAQQLAQRADARPVSDSWRALLDGAPMPTSNAATAAPPSASAIPSFLQAPPQQKMPALQEHPANPVPQMITPKMTLPRIERPQLRPPVLEPHNPRPPDPNR